MESFIDFVSHKDIVHISVAILLADAVLNLVGIIEKYMLRDYIKSFDIKVSTKMISSITKLVLILVILYLTYRYLKRRGTSVSPLTPSAVGVS